MNGHPIPDAALDADIATLAKKGAGKTYLNKGLVERLLDMKRRVVVMDPLSIWWGLKALADGSPGYPVVVVGGPHADVPLDPTMGVELAAYVAGADVRMVIDVSELRAGALVTFSTAFLGELYRLNRDPLWLVLEEADVFAPQNPQANETFMLHEVDMIARRGRQRGFRLWTICQRPQEINKKTLSQTTTMVLMRLMSPQDREAAKKWLLAHGTKDQADKILTTLPSLKVGEGYVLAPELGILERANFPAIRTLDNSATPKAGEKRVGVQALARVDVGALRLALASTAQTPNAPAGQPVKVASAAELQAAEDRGHARGLAEGEAKGFELGLDTGIARAREAINSLRVAQVFGVAPPSTQMAPKPAAAPKPQTAAPNASGGLGLVQAAARVHPARLTWSQIATIAGRKPRGGHFNSSRKAVIDGGLLVEADGLVSVTDAGLAAAGVDLPKGPLADIWSGALPQPAAKMFDAIRSRPGVTIIGLATVLQMQPRGGHWNNGMATLKRNGLIREDGAGGLKLAEGLA